MDRFRKGLIFKIIGAILIAVGLLGLIAAKGLSTEPGFEDRGLLLVLGAAVSVGLAVAGSSLFARGRKLRFRLADDEPLDEGTPFVLYLRSFASEFKTNAPAGGPNQDAFPNVLRFASEEEKLAKALRVVGAGITVGKPGEMMPPLGFKRIYIEAVDWIRDVEPLMKNARLVILRIGDGKGLLEEIALARRLLRPEQLVLLVPKDSVLLRNSDDMDHGLKLLPIGPHGARWEADLVPGFTVPVVTKPFHHKVYSSIVGIIYFDSEWGGHTRLISDIAINFTHALDKAFKPVYKQLQVKVGVRLYHVIFALFVICLVGMISLSMYFGKKAPSESRHTSTRSPSRIEVENSNARR